MKKLIGVIIDSMDGEYQRNITEHLIRTANSRDVKLLFFGGSSLEAPEVDRTNNRSIFGLANARLLDGVIIVPSTMVHRFEETDMVGVISHLTSAPVVSIGMNIDGAHTIIVDNKSATKSIFEHMMTHYKLEDICYISGPMKNHEAGLRYEVWLELLAEHGIKYDSRKYFEGEFFTENGIEAVDRFIEDLGTVPKAIIAANDEMAIGAYTRLAQLGYHVPEDVGLAGFDNIERSSDFFPPITTYDQRIDIICHEALTAIEDLADKKNQPGYLMTQGELVVRESCGCLSIPSISNHKALGVKNSDIDDSIDEIDRIAKVAHDDLMALLISGIREDVLPSEENALAITNYSEKLFDSFISDLREEFKEKKFAKTLNSLMSFSVVTEGKNSNPVRFIEELENYMMNISEHPLIVGRIKEILSTSINVINIGIRRREENYQYNFRRMYLMSRSVVREFNSVMSNEDIFKILEGSLPHYGISYCYMVLYKRPMEYEGIGRFIYPMMSDLVFSYGKGAELNPQSFVTNNMLPTQIIYNDHYSNLLFLSLDTGKTQYGYIAFSTDGVDFTIYETIRSHVSEAMKRHQINMKRLEAEVGLNNVLRELEISNELLRHQSIHDDMTGLYNRRGFYGHAESYFAQAVDKEEPFGLIFGDIDGLKRINDNYGHDEGDFAIKYVAKTLGEVLENKAIVGRMSGDEFTALVKNARDTELISDYIAEVNDRLVAFNKTQTKPYPLNLSMGYAPYDYKELQSMDDLLLRADKNMYRAKDRKKTER